MSSIMQIQLDLYGTIYLDTRMNLMILKELIRSGDGGPDFQSYAFLLFESGVYKHYGLELQSHLLCAYHAYNLCDAEKPHYYCVFNTEQIEKGVAFRN